MILTHTPGQEGTGSDKIEGLTNITKKEEKLKDKKIFLL